MTWETPLDVDAASGDVGRHQDVVSALAEPVHGPVALGLGQVALEGHGAMSGLV
jgi:hypothetical protein